ncbi:1-deoxy-D-xylulose-5-phosphate reductoisomerase [Chloroflexota bacterium]
MKTEALNIVVLGSTGSVGRQALDVARALPGILKIIGLAAGSNAGLLAEQVAEFGPEMIYLHTGGDRAFLPAGPSGTKSVSLEDMATAEKADIILSATSGKGGLGALLAAIKAGKTVALANKESLVVAGSLITAEAQKSGAHIRPVDSEHSAIWQCLQGEVTPPKRLWITASGGPFRGYRPEELSEITPEQALRHPSWQMGSKVTIDSATLMNKGLEVIEAHWLFDMAFDDIQVLLHPQSIVHSMVEFPDGSQKAQLGQPDMRTPIQYSLTYPERVASAVLPSLDWSQISGLEFGTPDYDTFPCLKLAVETGRQGGTHPAVLSATDEVAVDMFLSGRISFPEIPELVADVLRSHVPTGDVTLDSIEAADTWARQEAARLAGGAKQC